jgi:hypothetical protein
VLLTYVVPGGDTPGFRVLPWEVRVWELAPVIAVLVAEAAWIGIAARRRAFLARGGERWSGKRSARDT